MLPPSVVAQCTISPPASMLPCLAMRNGSCADAAVIPATSKAAVNGANDEYEQDIVLLQTFASADNRTSRSTPKLLLRSTQCRPPGSAFRTRTWEHGPAP